MEPLPTVGKSKDYWALLDVEAAFWWRRQWILMDSAPLQNWAKRVGFVAVSKTMAGVGRLKRICTHGFLRGRAVQETPPSHMLGGQGADFLRGVAFWSIRSSGLRKIIAKKRTGEKEREQETHSLNHLSTSGFAQHPCVTTTTPLLFRFPIFQTSATADKAVL